MSDWYCSVYAVRYPLSVTLLTYLLFVLNNGRGGKGSGGEREWRTGQGREGTTSTSDAQRDQTQIRLIHYKSP